MSTISIPQITPKTLIIGNGFDLSLELKTSFGDFFKSLEFKNLALINPLAKWINNSRSSNHKKWMDLEMLLTSLAIGEQSRYNFEDFSSNNPNLPDLYDQFREMKSTLISYLQSLNYEVDNSMRNSDAYRFIQTKIQSDPLIINFNYTPTVINILNDLNHRSFAGSKHVFIHASLENSEIVMGAGSKEESKHEFHFFKKSSQNAFSAFNTYDALLNTEQIYFFGHTLGQPDYSYFKPFFTTILNDKNYSKEITIITKDDRARKDIMDHLEVLTNNNVQDLRVYNDLNFEYTS